MLKERATTNQLRLPADEILNDYRLRIPSSLSDRTAGSL
jgi:hypothetical protein